MPSLKTLVFALCARALILSTAAMPLGQMDGGVKRAPQYTEFLRRQLPEYLDGILVRDGGDVDSDVDQAIVAIRNNMEVVLE